MLRKAIPMRNPSSSDVIRRLEKYLCVKLLATVVTDCYSM